MKSHSNALTELIELLVEAAAAEHTTTFKEKDETCLKQQATRGIQTSRKAKHQLMTKSDKSEN